MLENSVCWCAKSFPTGEVSRELKQYFSCHVLPKDNPWCGEQPTPLSALLYLRGNCRLPGSESLEKKLGPSGALGLCCSIKKTELIFCFFSAVLPICCMAVNNSDGESQRSALLAGWAGNLGMWVMERGCCATRAFSAPCSWDQTAGVGSSDGSTKGTLRRFLVINSSSGFPWVWLAAQGLWHVDRLGINDMSVKRIAIAFIQSVDRSLENFFTPFCCVKSFQLHAQIPVPVKTLYPFLQHFPHPHDALCMRELAYLS